MVLQITPTRPIFIPYYYWYKHMYLSFFGQQIGGVSCNGHFYWIINASDKPMTKLAQLLLLAVQKSGESLIFFIIFPLHHEHDVIEIFRASSILHLTTCSMHMIAPMHNQTFSSILTSLMWGPSVAFPYCKHWKACGNQAITKWFPA